jgi:hypothetical protein
MANALSSESDTYSGINRSLAQQCIQLIRTVDGSRMIDFLCPAFASDLKDKAYVVKKASEFARLSLREFENKNSTKLTRYYTKLCAYFKESGVGL